MSHADSSRAELQAARVLAKLKMSALPVDPFVIAAREGIACQRLYTGSGVSGCLSGVGNSFAIFYSDSVPSEGFRRFTVAHELGHYFLEGHYKHIFSGGVSRHESVSGYSSDDEYEREADAFAAALLMPEGPFIRAREGIAPGLKAIEVLADECLTSLTATAIRYAVLSDHPTAVVGSKAGRVHFAFMSKILKERSDLTWIKKNSGIPQGTATHRFSLDPDNIARAKRIVSSSLMDAWFDCGGRAYLTEEVIGLGSSYGMTLTVLTPDSCPETVDAEDYDEQDFEDMLPSDRWRQSQRD